MGFLEPNDWITAVLLLWLVHLSLAIVPLLPFFLTYEKVLKRTWTAQQEVILSGNITMMKFTQVDLLGKWLPCSTNAWRRFLVSFCSLVFSLVSGSISCLFWSSLCVSIGISGRRRKISDKGAISRKWLIGIDCSAESGVLTVLTLLGKLEGFSWSWHWALTSHPGRLASARSAAGSE